MNQRSTQQDIRRGIIIAVISVLGFAAACSICTLLIAVAGALGGDSNPGGILFLLVLSCAFVGALAGVVILDAPRRAAVAQQRQAAYLAQQQYAAYVAQQQYAAHLA